tara:strand:+ start:220 stop:504 length:285 start_codon:yes stop_codon:yes gene_type:complete
MMLRNTLSASIAAREIFENRTEYSRTPSFSMTDIMPDAPTLIVIEKPLPMEVIEKEIVGSILAFFAVLGISSFLLVLAIGILYFIMFTLGFSVI